MRAVRTATSLTLALSVLACAGCCLCQLQAGVYDFGQGRYGEKRGSWTPGEWLAAILLIMTIVLGLAISVGLCYYVNKRQARAREQSMGNLRFATTNYMRQQNNLEIGISPSLNSKAGTRPAASRTEDIERAAARVPGVADDGRRLQQQQQQAQRTPNDSLVVQI